MSREGRRRGNRRKARGRAAARPRLRLPSLGLLAVLGLTGYAAYQLHFLLFEASYFKVRRIEVHGAEDIGEDAVLRFSGVQLGALAFTVDPAEVRRRVEMIPKVDTCEVLLPSPNKVRITVTEKAEVARVVVDGEIHEVGPGGEIMRPAQAGSRAPLLLDAEILEGSPRRLSARQVARIQTWFPILATPPTQGFSRVRFGGGGRLDVHWRGIRLVVDDPARFEKHRSFLGPVLADARERGLGFDYVDLRFQDVVVRYRALGHPLVEPAPGAAAMTAVPAPAPRPARVVERPPAVLEVPPIDAAIAARAGNQENGGEPSELEAFMREAARAYRPPGGAGERGPGS